MAPTRPAPTFSLRQAPPPLAYFEANSSHCVFLKAPQYDSLKDKGFFFIEVIKTPLSQLKRMSSYSLMSSNIQSEFRFS